MDSRLYDHMIDVFVDVFSSHFLFLEILYDHRVDSSYSTRDDQRFLTCILIWRGLLSSRRASSAE